MATKKSGMAKTEMATKRGGTAKMVLDATPIVTPSAKQAGAFFDIPLALIIIEGQIRARIDQASEAFRALVESIREKGVLEPIIVTRQNGNYLLISGERRFRACQELGMATIPARVIDAVTAKDEILSLQLTENLQREDLDPIDEANALLSYFQARNQDTDLDVAMNAFITMDRDPARLDQEVAATVAAIQKILGKSSTSIKRCFSILKFPEEIQSALREGVIGVSQGYIFAANLDHPNLIEIFQRAVGEGFTNAGLEKELKKGVKPATTGGVRKRSFSLYRRSVQSVRTGIEEQVDAFKKSDLETLLNDLRELVTLVEGRLPEAIDDGNPVAQKSAKSKKK